LKTPLNYRIGLYNRGILFSLATIGCHFLSVRLSQQRSLVHRQSTLAVELRSDLKYTGCFRRNSKYFRSWYYGQFRL